MYELSRDAIAKNCAYLVVTLPLLWALGRELYGPERAALGHTFAPGTATGAVTSSV
jgi:hypothetical protein